MEFPRLARHVAPTLTACALPAVAERRFAHFLPLAIESGCRIGEQDKATLAQMDIFRRTCWGPEMPSHMAICSQDLSGPMHMALTLPLTTAALVVLYTRIAYQHIGRAEGDAPTCIVARFA